MKHQTYPTDQINRQWQCILLFIPPAKAGGRPRSVDMRHVTNAILYIVVTAAQWRMLPTDYPKWQTVYHCFRQWRDNGMLQHIHDPPRAEVRRRADRHKHPSAGCLDSQRV